MVESRYKRSCIKKFLKNKKFLVSKELFDSFVQEIILDLYKISKINLTKDEYDYLLISFDDKSNFHIKILEKEDLIPKYNQDDFIKFLQKCLDLFNFEKERQEEYYYLDNGTIQYDVDILEDESTNRFKENNYFTFEAHAQLALYLEKD